MSERGDPLQLMPAEPNRVISSRTWIIAATAILLLGVAAILTTLHRAPAATSAEQGEDAYAASLPISNVTMAEATNGAGGKSVYVDGTVANTGARTLTGASLQVTFAVADGSVPYRETVPLQLIRTREPYVDLQSVSAAPLGPGQSRDFRLIFESIPAHWDVKPPAIHIVRTSLR